MNKSLLTIICILIVLQITTSHSCLNSVGEPVSWWIILKVPPMVGDSGYGYYDSNSKSG
jgi:hypothetical protein